MQAIPAEVILAIESRQLDSSLAEFRQNTVVAKLLDDSILVSLSNELSLLRQASDYFEGHSTGNTILCVSRVTQQRNGLLLLSDFSEDDDIGVLLDGSKYDFSEQSNYWQIESDGSLLYGFLQNGVLGLSSHPLLIESAIKSLTDDQKPLFDQAIFGGAKEKLWFNFSSMYWMLPKVTTEDVMELGDALEGLGAIGCYKYKIEKDVVDLYGSAVPTHGQSALNQRSFGAPSSLKGLQMVPARTTFFYGYSGINFDGHLRVMFMDSMIRKDKEAFERDHHLDLLNDMVPLLGSEFIYGALDPVNHKIRDHSFLIVPIMDEEQFAGLIQTIDTNNQLPMVDSTVVRKLPNSGIIEWLFGKSFASFNAPYCFVKDGFCVFANSLETIRSMNGAVSSQGAISQSLHFNQALDGMTPESNFLLYVQPYYARLLARDVLRGDFEKWFQGNYRTLGGINNIVFQLTKTGNRFYSHVRLTTQKEKREQQVVMWEKTLDGQITYGPFAVTNYVTKKQEILSGNQAGNISLITGEGEIRWTQNFESPGVQNPWEVDIYKNKKIQYLVPSNEQLLAIDRRGRLVSGYPIRLPAKLSGQVAVYDFKNNGDYQILVPCEGQKILGYTAKGRPLSGWNPQKLEANGIGRVQYFAKGNEKFYFIADEDGNIYLWNKSGKKAQKLIATEKRFVSDFTMQFAKDLTDCKLLALDASGQLVKAKLGGEVEVVDLPSKWPDAQGFWNDVDQDGGKDLLIWKGSSVVAYAQSMKEVLRINSQSQITNVEVLEADGKGHLIALHSKSGHVHLFNSKGLELKNSPYPSTSGHCMLMDIDKDGSFELVTSVNNKIITNKAVY